MISENFDLISRDMRKFQFLQKFNINFRTVTDFEKFGGNFDLFLKRLHEIFSEILYTN